MEKDNPLDGAEDLREQLRVPNKKPRLERALDLVMTVAFINVIIAFILIMGFEIGRMFEQGLITLIIGV